MKLLTIIGARPQIIKAAAISRAVNNLFSSQVEEHILHTGQHYDLNMSQIFFDELGIPQPNYNLGVGSGSHGVQTAKMISGIEEVLQQEAFDGVILYGDTNSTLAGAVAAAKLHVPVFHVEAGLRSFNMSMPEEINRILCDHASSICFAPTQTAINNLAHEGLTNSPAHFLKGHRRLVVLSGDVMFDNSIFFAQVAHDHSHILEQHGLIPEGYILATIHRDHNTDDTKRLSSIIRALADISESDHIPVVLPLHPRTRVKLEHQHDISQVQLSKLTIIPPVSFLDMTQLEKNACIVMTDSGGVQKEAFFFEKPSVILRPETEWVEIIDHQAGLIADADYQRIVDAYAHLVGHPVHFPPLFGDAHASEKILQTIINYL